MNSGAGDTTQLVPGSPIRTPWDHSSVDSSPRPIAASHVLHRLLVPRHPPCALSNLTTKMLASTMQFSTNTHPHPPHHNNHPPAQPGRTNVHQANPRSGVLRSGRGRHQRTQTPGQPITQRAARVRLVSSGPNRMLDTTTRPRRPRLHTPPRGQYYTTQPEPSNDFASDSTIEHPHGRHARPNPGETPTTPARSSPRAVGV